MGYIVYLHIELVLGASVDDSGKGGILELIQQLPKPRFIGQQLGGYLLS